MAGEARRQRIRTLMALAGAAKADVHAFDAAFVHETAVAEKLAAQSNERLEFFGDAVLGFVVAKSLYDRYGDASEGELALRKSSLVSDASLAATAERLGFEQLVLLGAGLAKSAPARRRSALADAFEAFLAVLYRECGLEAVATFVLSEHIERWEALGLPVDDPKTVLQEWTHRHYGAAPAYADRFEGADHERTFYADVTVAGDVCATGSGPSKKAAQRAAAASALALLAQHYDDVAPRPLSAAGGSPLLAHAPKAVRRRVVQSSRAKTTKRPHT